MQVCFADSREQAEGIYIIAKGWVDICLPVKQGGSSLRVLKRGFVIGRLIKSKGRREIIAFRKLQEGDTHHVYRKLESNLSDTTGLL
jgi:hypothetical protein